MLGKGLESLIPKKLKQDGAQAPSQAGDPPVPEEPSIAASPKRTGEEKAPLAPQKSPSTRPPSEAQAVFQIEVDRIKPNPLQPRREFDEAGLKELANSIREFGVIQPLVVTKVEREVPHGTEVEYKLIAGERRLMAAKILGLPRVPVIVKKIDAERERLEMAMIENLQREDLNSIERARAFARLQDEFNLTQREIAVRLGKSRETVANTMRLLDLPSYIQEAVAKGEISESHGRLLLVVAEPVAQEKLFRDLLDKHMTTRDLKHRVEVQKGTGDKEGTAAPKLPPELMSLEERLSSELGAPVKIVTHGDPPAGGGKITITFYSGEELKNIVERLGGKEE